MFLRILPDSGPRLTVQVGNVESGNGGGASIEGSIFAASTTGLGLEEVIEN